MSIEKDIKKLVKNLNNLERKQLPFAAAVALTNTAQQVQKGVTRQLRQDIDRPTPFTQKAFKVNRATKSKLIASVEIKPVQAKYLRYQILGGDRAATPSKPVIIPRENQRNKYGNLPRGKLAKLRQKGVLYKSGRTAYQRLKRTSKAVAYFAARASYRKRFRFYERGESVARKTIVNNFRRSLAHALRTAK